MINVYVLNADQKTTIKLKKEKKYNICVLNNDIISKYKNEISRHVSLDDKLYFDYLRLYIAYFNSGLILDGNLEIKESLYNFFDNEIFFWF